MNDDARIDAGADRGPSHGGGPNGEEALKRRGRTVRFACALFVLASLGVCVAFAVFQIFQRESVDEYRVVDAALEDTDDPSAPDPSESAEEGRLLEMLPLRVGGFRTAARHDVPGFELEMAEAIYLPADEEVSIRTPLNCYVVVRAVGGDRIEEEFERLAAGHPERVTPPDLGSAIDEAFAARDRSTYVIGWRRSGYLFLVDTRFTLAVPAEQADLLEIHGAAVAAAVVEEMGR